MAEPSPAGPSLRSLFLGHPDQQSIPRQALVLGIAGVLPFIGLTLAALWWPDLKLPGLGLYGAVILSFMGGVQWGLSVGSPGRAAQTAWRRYGASVIPALVAWASFLLPSKGGLTVLIVGFLGLLAYDLWTALRGEAPMWYGRMRLLLTIAVVSCLIVAILALPD